MGFIEKSGSNYSLFRITEKNEYTFDSPLDEIKLRVCEAPAKRVGDQSGLIKAKGRGEAVKADDRAVVNIEITH